jgi:hypothetical protein
MKPKDLLVDVPLNGSSTIVAFMEILQQYKTKE